MASTAVQISNMALSRVGSTAFISALDEDTPEAELLALYYEQKRDSLLEQGAWPWATRRVTLSALASYDATTEDVWEYVYALPADCLEVQDLWPGTRIPSSGDRIPFAVEWDATNACRVICTDEEDAVLVYTRKVTDATTFPGYFVDALAWALAAELALGLIGKPELFANAQAMADRSRAKALAKAGNTGRADVGTVSEFEAERA